MGMKEKIENSIESLNNWIIRNGWSGYDPYDLKSIRSILLITRLGNKNPIFEGMREILFETFNHFPVFSRRIFQVEQRANAKAMGLFASAYLDLYGQKNDPYYHEQSKFCLGWLKENNSPDFPGLGWGYPFDWQSTELIPKHTPNGIVTTAVGEAFWKWYMFTRDESYLDDCIKICKFLITLPYDTINDEQICFSYTPIFQNHVHNLNLFVAEYLLKIGQETGNQDWMVMGRKALNYTLANQQADGAFDYNGPPERPQNFVDNYHSAFVLRMVHSIWKQLNEEVIFKQLELAYNYYIENFFQDGYLPKFKPDQLYRIDIHSCAESINCLSELADTFPDGLELAQNVARWTIDNLQDQQGFFYYGIFKSRFTGRKYTSKIAYIRWGQAWMLKALSNLLKRIS